MAAQDLCDIAWDPEVRISSDSAISTLPAIGGDNGSLHILWFGLDDTPALTLASSGIQYARSTDGGMNFTPPVTLLPFINTLSPGGALAVDGNRVFVTASAIIDTSLGIVLFESTDGGTSWSNPRYIFREEYLRSIPTNITAVGTAVIVGFRDLESRQAGILRSLDGGLTWDPPFSIGREFTDVEVIDGRIHAVGPYPGAGQTEVGYSFSPDSGLHWFGFTPISPEDQVRSVSGRISASPGGYLHVSWIDTGRVIVRSSRNNGVSWAGWTMLSEEGGNLEPDIGSDSEFVFVVWGRNFGDTLGLRARLSNDFGATYCPVVTPAGGPFAGEPVVLVDDSTVHLAWVDRDGDSQDVYYRRGTLRKNPEVVTHAPQAFSLSQSYPNPANGTVYINFDVPVSSEIVVELWSAIGQRVSELVRRSYDPGRYTLIVEVGGLPSGAYFYRLTSPGYTQTRKLMVLR